MTPTIHPADPTPTDFTHPRERTTTMSLSLRLLSLLVLTHLAVTAHATRVRAQLRDHRDEGSVLADIVTYVGLFLIAVGVVAAIGAAVNTYLAKIG